MEERTGALTDWWLQGGAKVSEAKVIYQELSEKFTSTVRTPGTVHRTAGLAGRTD